MRTADSLTYRLSDGEFQRQVFSRPIHYRDPSGAWKEIDVSLVPTETFGVSHTAASAYDETFASADVTDTPVTVTHDDWELGARLVGGEQDGVLSLGDTARYPLAMTDTRLEYQVGSESLKDTLVLSSKSAPDTFTFFVKLKNLSIYSSAEGGGYVLLDSRGKQAGHLEPLQVFDSSGAAASDLGSGAVCTSATMSAVAVPGGAYVTYRVPRDWLEDPARVYPVSVDPTWGWEKVVDDTYVSQNHPTSAYDSECSMYTGWWGSSHTCRSLLKFDEATLGIPMGSTISTATLQLFCVNNTGTDPKKVHVWAYPVTGSWKTTGGQTWSNTFTQSAPFSPAGSFAYTTTDRAASSFASATYEYWDITKMVQHWYDGQRPNNGILMMEDNDSTSTDTYRQYNTADNHQNSTSSCPHLVINYSTPAIAGGSFDRASYKPGDEVNAAVVVSSRVHPTNVQADIMSGSTWRGRFIYTSFDPNVASYLTTSVADPNTPGGYDWFSFDPTPDPSYANGSVMPDFSNCSVKYDGSTCSVRFAYKIGATYGDTQSNHLWALDCDWTSTNKAMDTGASYGVLPALAAPASATTTATCSWWSQTDGSDDSSGVGRGSATLSWPAAASAAGYNVYLFDGNQYDKVATTTATSWSSAGKGLYPSDSAISRLATGTKANPYLGGTGLDLRDDPRPLYARTASTAWDGISAYAFKVVPYNSFGAVAVSDSTTVPVTLDCRTRHLADDPQHTGFDLAGIEDDGANVLLDRGALQLSAVDLSVNSYGPHTEISRTYGSDRLASGMLGAPGWLFGFEQSVSSNATSAVYTDDLGDRHVFRGSGPSNWLSPSGLDATLTGGGGTPYVLTYQDRSRKTFSSSGVLTAETDANGLSATIGRSTDGGGHAIVTLAAPNGRSIVLTALGSNRLCATYAVSDKSREVDYDWAGTGSGGSASGTLTVSYGYSDGGATPTSTTRYVYSGGRIVAVLVTASRPIANTDGTAEWDFGYTGEVLTNVSDPPYDPQGHRAVTLLAYGADASGLADATVTQRGEVEGRMRDISQTFGLNPTGTMAYRTNPRALGDAVRTWAYTYSAEGDQASETNPDGAVVRSIWDSTSDEIQSIDALQRSTFNCYDQFGDAISSTDPAGSVTTNTYDANGNLTCTTKSLDASGDLACTKSAYDSAGTWRKTSDCKELSATGSASRWLLTTYAYDADNGTDDPSTTTQSGMSGDLSGNNLAAESIDLGGGMSTPAVSTSLTYDGWGNPTKSTDASGNSTSRTYDLAGNATSSTDPLGLTTNTTYDAFGHATSTWRSRADTAVVVGYSQSDFDAFGRQVQTRTYLTTAGLNSAVLNNTVTITFDPMGRQQTVADSSVAGAPDTSQHDAMGHCTKSWTAGLAANQLDDAHAVRSSFDAEGRETGNILPGATMADAKAYNLDGTLATESNPDGTTSTYVYDASGDVISVSTASTAGVVTTRGTYDVGGRRTQDFDGDGNETNFGYDLADRQTTAKGPEGLTASTTQYNALDWVTLTTDADGISTTDRYDTCGRVVAETVGSGLAPSTNSYDAGGNALAETDPNGRQLSNRYDPFGRLVEQSQVSTTNPAVPLVQRTLKDEITTFDSLSRPARVADGRSGLVTAYTYAAPGTVGPTLAAITYGGLTTTTTVDAAGDETARVTSGGGLTFSRSVDATDQAGRITAWHIGGFYQSRCFDSVHQVSQDGSSFSHPGSYAFAGLGGRKSEEHLALCTGAGGPIDWAYRYNADDRLISAAQTSRTAESFQYDDGGNVTTFTAVVDREGTVQSGALHYDGLGRLDKRFDADGTTVRETYVYDSAQGYRTGQQRAGEPSVTLTYTGQRGLATYFKPAGAQGDAASVNAAYGYDATGQRLHSQVTRTSGTVTTSTDTTWTYSGTQLLSLNASQSVGASATWQLTYLYDNAGRPYAGVYQSDTASATAFAVVTTDRGDVVALTDLNGNAFASYRYDAWGRPLGQPVTQGIGSLTATLAAEIAPRQVLRYAGYVYDAEDGFYYCSARTYDPNTMQFLQKDPAKSDGEESAYQYGSGNSVSTVDPSGLQGDANWATADDPYHKSSQKPGKWAKDKGAKTRKKSAPHPSWPPAKPVPDLHGGCTLANMLAAAKSQVGYHEAGHNLNAYGAWYGDNGDEWCDMFVSWCASKVGGSKIVGKEALTSAHALWFKKVKHAFGSKPRVGAIVFFNFGHPSWGGRFLGIHHVGIVEHVVSNSEIKTIEGNHDDAVRRVTRHAKDIAGYGYPAYK